MAVDGRMVGDEALVAPEDRLVLSRVEDLEREDVIAVGDLGGVDRLIGRDRQRARPRTRKDPGTALTTRRPTPAAVVVDDVVHVREHLVDI
jgi:hypothetical protein